MRRVGLITVLSGVLLASVFAIRSQSARGWGSPSPSASPSPTVYNPYPPGILPPNLNSEIARVQREVQFIEGEAIGEWHALPPPDLTGQPPILKGSGYQMVEVLGKLMNFDLKISPFKNEA